MKATALGAIVSPLKGFAGSSEWALSEAFPFIFKKISAFAVLGGAGLILLLLRPFPTCAR